MSELDGYIKINTEQTVTDNKGLLLGASYSTMYVQVYEYNNDYYVESELGNLHLTDREYLVPIYCSNDIDHETLTQVIRERRLGKLLD